MKTTKTKKKKEISLDDLTLMMGRGSNEVQEKMDKGFAEVDERFDKVDGKIKYIVSVIVTKEEISELPTKSDFNNLLTSVDEYAKKADTYFQEMVGVSA